MSILSTVIGWFTGNSAVSGAVGKVADVVDKAVYTGQEQAKDAVADANSARALPMPSHGTWLDVLVDAINRLIRPSVTIWLCGGLAGFWPLPKTGDVDPVILNVFWTVMGFWFGGRMLLKDLPAFLRELRR